MGSMDCSDGIAGEQLHRRFYNITYAHFSSL
jgi:hypothetical protein